MLLTAANVKLYSEFSPMLSDGPGKLITRMTPPERRVDGVGDLVHQRVREIFCKEINPDDISRIETWYSAGKCIKGSVVYSRLVVSQPILYLPSAYFGGPDERCLSGVLFDTCGVPRQMWLDAENAVSADTVEHLLVHTREQDVGAVLLPQSLDKEWRCVTLSCS
ncbi:hypothetical protein I8H83_00200 [Candidatus Saccharibacteria bacterium]|nr:hypothetical protein [Candidatus Saccharibacteria bacterium]